VTTNRTDAIDENEPPDIIQLTSRLVQDFERLFLSTVADITWDQFDIERMNYVEKVCIVRQHEAICAALLLAQHGLGHLAVAYVRPACEEYIWLAYLNSIDPHIADLLVGQLMLVENSRSIDAQRQYLGNERMMEYGWPSSYMRFSAEASTVAKGNIEQIATRLGWPNTKSRQGKGRPPKAKWIAEQTNSASLYDFLYSATSRMLHFSPQEIFRRGWGNPDENATISLDDPSYTRYRLDFALYWLVYLLLHTYQIMKSGMDDEQHEDDEQLDAEAEELGQLIREWASYLGEVPIIRPEELNIPQGPIPNC
jgi:hypothetical protein